MSKLFPNAPSGADIHLSVIGGCGEYQSGKTIFGLSIAPGTHPDGSFKGQARTLCLDFEKSATTYTGLGAEIRDVNDLLTLQKNDYSARDVYLWFRDTMNEIQPGQFDVIMVDTVTEIENGMLDEIRACPQKYGLTAGQIAKSEALVWGKLKDMWKALLLKLSARCETFYFTAHMRNQFSGNTPTKKREPKGKEVLMELANLYLQFDRSPDPKTRKVPAIPNAKVLKHRLADTQIDPETGEVRITPLIPPTIEACSVAKLREYIAKGVDYNRNAKELRVEEEQPMSETEKLTLEMAIADRRIEAAALEMELRQKAGNAAERRARVLESRKAKEPEQEPEKEPEATEPEPAGNVPFEVDPNSDDPISDVESLAGDWHKILAKRLESASTIRKIKFRRFMKELGKETPESLTDDEAKDAADLLT